jgi:hypothetical protein
MDAQKLAQLIQLAQELGSEIRATPDEAEAYFAQVGSDFYIPQKHQQPGFDAAGLRKMSLPDPNIFRRLLGIR